MPFHCFAYGSNMFTPKMRRVAPSATFSAVARLPGYRLRFNKVSDDGSGKGNIVPTEDGAEVWGVIFEIADRDRKSLDGSEGGYAPLPINAVTDQGVRPVLIYVANPKRVDNTRKPYSWYKAFVVRGAEEHGLPQSYRDALAAVVATKDPNPTRERENLSLLASG